MENKKQIKQSFNKLNISENNQEKLTKIMEISNSLNLQKMFNIVANIEENSADKDHEITFNAYGRNDAAFERYDGHKKLSSSNELEEINLQITDKARLMVGLKDYVVENFNLKNLNEKDVSVNYKHSNIYFDKPQKVTEKSFNYKFDKKNNLQGVEVETIVDNKKQIAAYDKKQIQQMLEKAEEMKNKQDKGFER